MLEEYTQLESSDPESISPHGPFNLLIQDQRNAFAWIHKFVAGFGGDPNNITAFGESAGSLLLIYHICGSETRLFNRAILQSGMVMGHSLFEMKEAEYQGLLKHFKIEGATATERLDKLRQVPADKLVKYPGHHMLPFVGDLPQNINIRAPLFPRGAPTSYSQTHLIPTCTWLEDIVLGDDFWEGHALLDYIRDITPEEFSEVVKATFPDLEARHS